ncbi:NAD(P)/FAD-dependent oxidoreductase [Curtobacterium sp. 24E2]
MRAKRTVLLVDANRPRNAATLRSHGFLTRDGISPLELRKLGRAEVEEYPEATIVQAVVDLVAPDADGWRLHGTWRGTEVDARARTVVVATGLREEFPALPMLRAFYGTAVHSCVECDAYEKAGSRSRSSARPTTSWTGHCSSRRGPTTSSSTRTVSLRSTTRGGRGWHVPVSWSTSG